MIEFFFDLSESSKFYIDYSIPSRILRVHPTKHYIFTFGIFILFGQDIRIQFINTNKLIICNP